MPSPLLWLFDPFRLDPTAACLWQGDREIALRPKTFAVLEYLVTHPDQLVTKEVLLEAVWPETAVSDAVLKNCVKELRQALGETTQAPQFIATVYGRGYRFIAPVTLIDRPLPVTERAPVLPPPSAISIGPQPAANHADILVERESVLRRLHMCLHQARQGHRQVVFVTGEPGIGKTAVMEAFTAQAAAAAPVRIVWGQCVEYYGEGEAYLPVLEALAQLCQGPESSRMVAILRQQAPTWLVQMPWLLSPTDRNVLQHELQGITRARMLRELATALAALTAETPLAFVLEDLHWSDHATLDVVRMVARRRESARLMLLGTYRSVDVIVREHPLHMLAQDLQAHGYSTELPLELLSEAAVAAYLAARLPGAELPSVVAHRLVQRTGGHPLFVVNVIEHLLTQGALAEKAGRWEFRGQAPAVEISIPESLRQLIAQQLKQLTPEEQQVVEAGSVAGVEFPAVAVAAGLEGDIMQVEACCEALVRQGHVLRSVGSIEWLDGTVTERYGFRHALYQEVTYKNLRGTRRAQLHWRIGDRLERAYGERAREIAAELAVHYAQGRDAERAVRYRGYAGENALRRNAYQEAIAQFTHGIEILRSLPDTPGRLQQELGFQTILGPVFITVQGEASREVEQTYLRARELCRELGGAPQLFPVLMGLLRCYVTRGNHQQAEPLAEELFHQTQHRHDPALLVEAHLARGITTFCFGDLPLARMHLEQSLAFYDPYQHRDHWTRYARDPQVVGHSLLAWTLWALGYADQAAASMDQALELAEELAHPASLGFARNVAAGLCQQRREVQETLAYAESTLALATEFGLSPWVVAPATMFQGWAATMQGREEDGIVQLQQGVAVMRSVGFALRLEQYAQLAEAHGRSGHAALGLLVLAEALEARDRSLGRWYEAELHRLKSVLLLQEAPTQWESAEACLRQALTAARRDNTKLLELRVAVSLSRLWRQQGKWDEAYELLSEVYGWFTEGFETPDLREAKALLETLTADRG